MPQLTDNDVAEIRALREPWIEACLARDWKALFELCTPDVTFFPPEAPMAEGFESAWEYMDDFPPITSFEIEFTRIDGRDDLAMASGHFGLSVDVDGAEVFIKGKFLDTFRKSGDGHWHYDQVMWNADHSIG